MSPDPKADVGRPVSVVVVGLAREGMALTRFLAERGARVTVTDSQPAESLAHKVSALAELPVRLVLGEHPPELLDATDLVFVSPGVPLEIPFLVEARERGLPLSSETRLFTRLCRGQIVAITGSSGKTTTTSLTGEMLQASGRRTWVGGNIGRPLVGHLHEISPADIVVMELSSFQLEFFAPWGCEGAVEGMGRQGDGVLFDPTGWSPPIAGILNITPNHLDRHATMESYTAAKAHILAYQQAGDVAVLNLDNAVTRQMGQTGGLAGRGQKVLWFSLEQEPGEGCFVCGDELVLRRDGQEERICRRAEVPLLGWHNVANVLAACALAAAAGAPIQALRQVATTFRGVEHRLELVRERGGVRWYNDSIATSPERTVAALQAFDAPVVLLAGGRDKRLAWGEMASLTWQKVRHLILFGEAAGLIERAMEEERGRQQEAGRGRQEVTARRPEATREPVNAAATQQATAHTECEAGDRRHTTCIHHAGTLERAVRLAAQMAQPGDVVLLSPGGTSFDAYADFVARGEHFRQLVQGLE